MADRRAQNDSGGNACGAGFSQRHERRLPLAGRRRVDGVVEHERGRIGDDRAHVVETDPSFALRVERELVEFGSRSEAVGAEQPHQLLARIGLDREARLF